MREQKRDLMEDPLAPRTLAVPAPLPVCMKPTSLGPYQLIRLLGEGAMGRVFLARHARLGRQVALKLMRPELAVNATLVQRFVQEAKAANQIHHEHIVQIFDFIEDESVSPPRLYCVMEYLPGSNLAVLLSQEAVSLKRLVGIARQVCSALSAAHDVGIVHRDVKPDNIFVATEPTPDFVKLLDFGIAKLLSSPDTLPVSMTVDGMVLGTPTYMAPEQMTNRACDGRTDQYSLGVVLYQALAGRPPFQSRSFGELLLQVQSAAPPPLPASSRSGEPLPPALRELVMRCLQKRPERRFPSMQALSAALAPFESAARPSARLPTRPLAWAGAAAVALGVVSASGAARWNEQRTQTPGPAPTRQMRTTFRLRATSEPSGALVTRLDSRQVLGVTPLDCEVEGIARPLTLRWELEGHAPVEQQVELAGDLHLVASLGKVHRPTARKLTPEVRRVVADKRKRGSAERESQRDDTLNPFAQ